MQSTGVAAHSWQESAPRKALAHVRSRYWGGSVAAAILAIALTAVRVGEQLGPVRYLKPVFTATLVGVLLHLTRTHSAEWRRLWRSTSMRLILLYCLTVVLSFPLSIWRGQTWATMQVLPWDLGWWSL